MFWWPGIPLPSVRRDTFASSVVIPAFWRSPSLATDHWGSLMGPLSQSPPQRSLTLPLEVTSAWTRGVCYGWRPKVWTWSDAQEELIISVHWKTGESSNAMLSSLLPMPRPIKYPCGIWETPIVNFPLLDGTWTCFSQRNVQTKLLKPLPDSETFKDVPIYIK